ncbi:unnamed protein product [Caenorhabditis brenneri]
MHSFPDSISFLNIPTHYIIVFPSKKKTLFFQVISQNAELTLVKAWTDYAEEIEADIRALLPFIDELQDSFNSHDKAILLKRSAFQIYLLRRIRALNPYGLLLSDGRVIKLISLQFLYGTPLINEMLQVVSRILQLGCTDEDIAMFITIVYYKPGRIEDLARLNLQSPENLSPAQQKFKKLFVKHAESRGVDQRVFQNLIHLWPELERLKVMHQERLEVLKPYRWAFPENSLFAEVYDIDRKIVTTQSEFNSSPVISQNAELTLVKAWTDYAEEIEADIRALLLFIDELQDSFNSHDKAIRLFTPAILLKRSAFQIYLLRRIKALNPYGLLLSDGRVIKLTSLQFLYGTPLINEVMQFVSRILQLGCTDEDIAMFITIVYYKPGRQEDLGSLNLQNPENLSSAQQKFKKLFVKHAENRGVDQRVFQNLINLWPKLERLKLMHQERMEILKPYRWAFLENSALF